MNVHLIRIALIVLAVVGPLLATPVAASPKDPDSFQGTPIGQGECSTITSFVDPLTGLCPSGLPELVTNQLVSSGLAETQRLLPNAVDAVTGAGSPQYTLDMRTMSNRA